MTDLIVPSRRRFLTGLATLIAAPAIVQVGSLMPIRGSKLLMYDNRFIRKYLDVQAIRDTNVLFLNPSEYAGLPVASFRGIPIRVVDQIDMEALK